VTCMCSNICSLNICFNTLLRELLDASVLCLQASACCKCVCKYLLLLCLKYNVSLNLLRESADANADVLCLQASAICDFT
jgi:hypothetical protein